MSSPNYQIAYVSKPAKTSDIDRSHFHALARTDSPLKVLNFQARCPQTGLKDSIKPVLTDSTNKPKKQEEH